ncbi:MAG: transcription-repair coupling factor, partial [Pseudomonadota bacterium]
MTAGLNVKNILGHERSLTIGNVPAGFEPVLLADMARTGTPIAYVVSDGQSIPDLEQILSFVAPDIPVFSLPAWDCLPYDRVSPGADVSARRLATLSALVMHAKKPHAAIVLVTANALLQKIAPKDVIEA